MCPVVFVGSISALLFTILVILASYVTTFFMNSFEHPTYGSYFFYVSPIEVAQDLITAAFRVLKDGELGDILEEETYTPSTTMTPKAPGVVRWFVRRFLIGLPLVGAGSLVHMLISLHVLTPVQWLARYRGSRSRRNNSDIAALIVVSLLAIGALRLVTLTRALELLTSSLFDQGLVQGLPVNRILDQEIASSG